MKQNVEKGLAVIMKKLSSLCLRDNDVYQTKSTIGFAVNCSCIKFHNRVIIVDNTFDVAELAFMNTYHKGNAYTLWVDSANVEAKNKLTSNHFGFCISFPAMGLVLKNLPMTTNDSRITIRLASSDDEILTTLIPLVIRSYNLDISMDVFERYQQDWRIFFTYLRDSTIYQQMHFFLGCWNDIPVTTGLFIVNDDAVYIHWIGTLPEYRHRGLGAAITSVPLDHFNAQGIEKAFLFASAMGKPIYEKLGFETIGSLDIFETNNNVSQF